LQTSLVSDGAVQFLIGFMQDGQLPCAVVKSELIVVVETKASVAVELVPSVAVESALSVITVLKPSVTVESGPFVVAVLE